MRRFASTILIAILALQPLMAAAAPELVFNASAAKAAADAVAPKDVGTPTREVLSGNGRVDGYELSKKNVVPSSEWIYIGLRRAKRTVDYTIDYAAGAITFTRPIAASESIKVDYNYIEGASVQTSGGSLTTLDSGFAFGNGTRMNAFSNTQKVEGTATSNSSQLSIYGMNSSLRFGDSSAMSGMVFTSTPQEMLAPGYGSLRAVTSAPVADPKAQSDRLLLQNADLGMGKVRLKVGYQDVGKDFGGFSSLRESKASSVANLNMLEKEKGLKRLDVAGDLPVSGNNGLNFAYGKISDQNADILTQMFGYSSDSFMVNYGTREVGKDFTRFNDLRESDRRQMASEAGKKRTNYGMQFAGPGKVWNSFNVLEITGGDGTMSTKSADFNFGKMKMQANVTTMDQYYDTRNVLSGMQSSTYGIQFAGPGKNWNNLSMTKLEGVNGSLTANSVDLDLGKVQLQADVMKMDPTFDRMAALGSDDRKRIALAARRPFNLKATAQDVTETDKQQLMGEAGIDQAAFAGQFDAGIFTGVFAVRNLDAAQGGLNQTAMAIESKNKKFRMGFKHRSIDRSFDRLQSLMQFERVGFGNEYGMSRTEFDGALKLGVGELQFNQANVFDDLGATMVRQNATYISPKLTFKANMQDISSNFQRITDLSDLDCRNLVQDRGFKWSNYLIDYQLTKAINIKTELLDSTNPTAGQTADQNKFNISYAPSKGPKMTALLDDKQYYSEAGALSSYTRNKFTIDNKFALLGGLNVSALSDVFTSQDGTAAPLTTETTQTHLESDPAKKNSFSVDNLSVNYGNTQKETVNSLGMKTRLSNALAITGTMSVIDTNMQSSMPGNFGTFGVEWGLTKDLKMIANLANTGRGYEQGRKTRMFSLDGLLAKRLFFLSDIKVASGINTSDYRGKQTGCNNTMKLDAGLLGGTFTFDNSDKLNSYNGQYNTSRLINFASDANPAKWFHLKMFTQTLSAYGGAPKQKREYAADVKLTRNMIVEYKNAFGRDGQSGSVIPVGGSSVKLSRTLKDASVVSTDFTSDINRLTNMSAKIYGIGFTGKLLAQPVEFYYGFSQLTDSGTSSRSNVFRVKFTRNLDAKHKLSFTAQKKSGVDKTEINPYEGRATAHLDFETDF